MESVWFAIVSAMLAVYVVLDGFDFGAGFLHRFVARTDEERRTVLGAIGPVWDGNEVWLLASGGVLFMAFPRAYSAAFSGFYMALMIVLWLLILRGVAIEFRSQVDNPLWREFWDSTFALSSTLMALVLGTALGNVVRGVPVGESGYFAMPLFTDFRPGKYPGVFDWYTILVGAFALAALAGHGALFLVWKTTGPVQERSRSWAWGAWLTVLPLWIVVTATTAWLRPDLFENLLARPWCWPLVLLTLGGLAGVFYYLRAGKELPAFLSSVAFLLGMLAATMAGNYPVWLRSTINAKKYNLTADNAAAQEYGLQIGLVWWTVGIALAGCYLVYVFRFARGKVDVHADGHGY